MDKGGFTTKSAQESAKQLRIQRGKAMDWLLKTSHDQSLKSRLLSPAVPGYTGFVPSQGSQGLGESYGVRTRNNLVAFWSRYHSEELRDKISEQRLIFPLSHAQRAPILHEQESIKNSGDIYTPRGLVPNYTGYVPGGSSLHKIGESYGKITKTFGYDHKST